jgi:hypothetical protein
MGSMATAGAGGRGARLRWSLPLRPLPQQADGYLQGWSGAMVFARLEYQSHRVRASGLARLVPASCHYGLAGLLRGQPGRRTPQARSCRGSRRDRRARISAAFLFLHGPPVQGNHPDHESKRLAHWRIVSMEGEDPGRSDYLSRACGVGAWFMDYEDAPRRSGEQARRLRGSGTLLTRR